MTAKIIAIDEFDTLISPTFKVGEVVKWRTSGRVGKIVEVRMYDYGVQWLDDEDKVVHLRPMYLESATATEVARQMV